MLSVSRSAVSQKPWRPKSSTSQPARESAPIRLRSSYHRPPENQEMASTPADTVARDRRLGLRLSRRKTSGASPCAANQCLGTACGPFGRLLVHPGKGKVVRAESVSRAVRAPRSAISASIVPNITSTAPRIWRSPILPCPAPAIRRHHRHGPRLSPTSRGWHLAVRASTMIQPVGVGFTSRGRLASTADDHGRQGARPAIIVSTSRSLQPRACGADGFGGVTLLSSAGSS